MITDKQAGELALMFANGAPWREVLRAHEAMLRSGYSEGYSDGHDDGAESGCDAALMEDWLRE